MTAERPREYPQDPRGNAQVVAFRGWGRSRSKRIPVRAIRSKKLLIIREIVTAG
jgi:hypothetical protein